MASIIGASWTGARAMTATSGPGFSLMMENIGFAVMTETPCVVVNIQRGGPSTGQPTMAAAGDMMQCRFGSHGDYSAIALCPSSVQEMYELTVKAFNLADRFRVPVFLMADEIIGHMRERIIIPDKVERTPRRPLAPGVLPFHPEDDLVPGFPEFGKGFGVHVTGLTHDERGYPCATNPKLHEQLVMRLCNKIERPGRRLPTTLLQTLKPKRFLSRMVHLPALWNRSSMISGSKKIGHLRLKMVWPFPEHAIAEFPDATRFIIPELNLGQIAREFDRHTRIPVIQVPKLGGDLHLPAELKKLTGVGA